MAFILNAASAYVGFRLLVHSPRPVATFTATAILLVGALAAMCGLASKPQYNLGGTSYFKSRWVVCVFIDDKGNPCQQDHPTKPRAHWTDARQGWGIGSVSIAVAGILGLAYAPGWLWL